MLIDQRHAGTRLAQRLAFALGLGQRAGKALALGQRELVADAVLEVDALAGRPGLHDLGTFLRETRPSPVSGCEVA
jgi:hypothetical protein